MIPTIGFYRRTVDDLAGVLKAPNDTVDYTIDWVEHLPSGVTVASAVWTVPAGLTGTNEGTTDSTSTKRISGGTATTEYTVTCRMTKSNAEVVARSFVIRVVAALS